MKNNSIFDRFTNQYSLSKTLRFELEPQEGTKKLVRTLFEKPGENHHEIIKKDLDLSKSYTNVKKLIDCRHRNIINDVLSKFEFTDDELKKLNSNEIPEDETLETDKKDPLAKLRERVAKSLNDKNEIMFDNKLLNPETITTEGEEINGKKGKKKKELDKTDLEKWMNETSSEKYLKEIEFNNEAIVNDIERMKGFFTYFKGFNENRKNVYEGKKKIATSIPYRIVHDNFPIFKKNIDNYNKIIKEYPDLVLLIDEIGANNIFKLEYFNNCLTQAGIDKYNKELTQKVKQIEHLGIITKEQGKEKEQDEGINQIINRYVQQENKRISNENRDRSENDKGKKIKVATFDKLKKQILSIDRSKSFQFEVYEDTREIITGINERNKFLIERDMYKEMEDFLKNIDKYDGLDEIYLNVKSISTISKKLFDYGKYIEVAMEKMYDDKNIKQSGDARRKFLASKQFSIKMIEDSLKHYLDNYEQNQILKNKFGSRENIIIGYFKNPTITIKTIEIKEGKEIEKSEEKGLFDELELRKQNISYILDGNYTKDLKEEKEAGGDSENVKSFLDALMDVSYILSSFFVKDKNLGGKEKDEEFYNERKRLQELIFEADILALYNQTRNYITQKPYKLDKFKMTFENPQFANSWPSQKENDYKATLLRCHGEYKLLVFPLNNKLIYSEAAMKIIGDDYYEKMYFDQMADPAKDIPNLMVENGKTVRKTGRKEKAGEHIGENIRLEKLKNELLPIEINEIRKDKSYLKSSKNFNHDKLQTFITYYKERVKEYKPKASFNFKESYDSFPEFTDHVNEQTYQLNFDAKISKSWIDKQEKEGNLYIFRIHNKDYNPGRKGIKNLHTLYWEMLFDKKNLDDVTFKLNGGAELFYREATLLKNNTIHKQGVPVPKKFFELSDGTLEPVPGQSILKLNAYHKNEIGKDQLSEIDLKYIYNNSTIKHSDRVKDNRFTKDKIQFHCSITMNFKPEGKKNINDKVLDFLYWKDDTHIIGLDRGERHLIYLTLINKQGRIVDRIQYSLNEIERKYKVNGIDKVQRINYQELLHTKEGNRTEARKNWHTIENISKLKEGYLSLVIHQLAKMIVDYNAIIVLEDLNYGFKDSRAKVEKSVYQKFEKMLINKLQYLVLDKNILHENGGVLKGFQLTNEKIASYKEMSKQLGFLFYVPPDYTSKICPVTGFIDLLKPKYTNQKDAVTFLKKFEKIYYDTTNHYFRFKFDYKNFDKLRVDVSELAKTDWSVCAHPAKRSIAVHLSNKWVNETINVNRKLEDLFKSKIETYKSGNDLKDQIVQIQDAKFLEDLLKFMAVLFKLRHTYKNEDGTEHDTIVSPVEVVEDSNEFFISRDGNDLPANADANGAYNIARKGLWLLNKLDEEKDKEKAIKEFNKLKSYKKGEKSKWVPNKEWLKFAQK